jgi:hypothetical protein
LSNAEEEAFEQMLDVKAFEHFPVPADIYGDAIVSLVHFADIRQQQHMAKEHWVCLWMGTSVLLFLMNGVFQIGLSYLVYKFCLNRDQTLLDSQQLKRHEHLLRHSPTRLSADSDALELCHMSDVDFLPAYLIVVALWFTRMVVELSEACWLLYVVLRTPVLAQGVDTDEDTTYEQMGSPRPSDEESATGASSTPSGKDIIRVEGTMQGEILTIMHLPTWCKVCIVVFIVVPKMGIAVYVCQLGAKFLELARCVQTLVMKALTCAYFVTIDELIFKAFVSTRKQHLMKNTSFRYCPLGEGAGFCWVYWGSSWIRISVVVLLTCWIHFVQFGFLRDFRYACSDYQTRFPGQEDVGRLLRSALEV